MSLNSVTRDSWRQTHHVDDFFWTHEIQSYEDARRVYPCWTGRRTKKGIPYYIYKVAHLDKKVCHVTRWNPRRYIYLPAN